MSEQDYKELQQMTDFFVKHDKDDLAILCPHCKSENCWARADYQFHNHEPHGKNIIDEIWECDDCGKYFQLIWRLSDIIALDKKVVE